MIPNLKEEEVLEAAVAEIPIIADVIAAMPAEERTSALDEAERHYLQTARAMGCAAEPAREWVAAVMYHLQQHIVQMTEMGPSPVGPGRGADFGLAEQILSRATGVLGLVGVSPLFAFVWVGLKLERPGPAIELRTTTKQRNVKAYEFALGSGWASRFVRRAKLQALPILWHLINGDNVLRMRDFAEIFQFREGLAHVPEHNNRA